MHLSVHDFNNKAIKENFTGKVTAVFSFEQQLVRKLGRDEREMSFEKPP